MPAEVSAGLFTSLDGVIDADSDWQHPYFDAELQEHLGAGAGRTDTVLIGRRSFEGYRALRRDHPESPFVPFLERVERHVVSTTLSDPQWPGTRVIADDVVDRVRELKRDTADGISVLGSPSVVRLLLDAGELDVLGLIVLPVVVGTGPRLFPADAPLGTSELGLTEVRQFGSGAVALTYHPRLRDSSPSS